MIKITKSTKRTHRAATDSMLFSSSKKNKKATAVGSSSAINDAANQEKVLAIYNTLLQSTSAEEAEEEYVDPDLLTMEHIGKLCEQLNVDPSADVRVLVMLWKMGAVSTPGCITKTEFTAGCKKLRISSVSELRSLLPSFDPGFLGRADFRGK